MLIRWLAAALHLLPLGIGLGAVWIRGRAPRLTLDVSGLRRVFSADTLWGVAAVLWIGTGLLRAFAAFVVAKSCLASFRSLLRKNATAAITYT